MVGGRDGGARTINPNIDPGVLKQLEESDDDNGIIPETMHLPWGDPSKRGRDSLEPQGAPERAAAAPTPEGGMTEEDAQLLYDLTQLGFDLGGIADPTPVCDGISGAMALGSGDLLGAGISVISMISYIGDLAKAGKLGKAGALLLRVLERARKSADFAMRVAPLLKTISKALDAILSNKVVRDNLPEGALDALKNAKKYLDDFFAEVAEKAAKEAEEKAAKEAAEKAAKEAEQAAQKSTKATSPVWQDAKPYRGKTKTNGKGGKKREYYEWDNTHGDIEVYNSNGVHMGSMDPRTGIMIKPAVPGRKIDL